RAAEDHDVDRRVGERLFERDRPFPVTITGGELLGRLIAPSHDHVQHGIRALQRLGVPLPHHAVADHADVRHHDQPLYLSTGTPGTSTSSAKMPPVSGLAASLSALTFSRREVM